MKKWITYTLGVLLTLVVLGAVGMAGFRIGLMQSGRASHFVMKGQPPQFAHPANPNGNFRPMDRNFQNFPWVGRERGPMMFGHRNRMPFFSPLFSIGRILIIVLVIGLVYWLYKNSGWRFVRVGTSEAKPVEEKKLRQKSK